MQVVAHRGSSDAVPEHTLHAYTRAIDEGADALECDVRLTRDGHLVCVHDRRIDRTSTGEDWSTEPSPNRGVGTAAIVFNVRSGTAAPQPPLPRQAEIRVTDSASAAVGAHVYAQQ